MPQTNNSVIRRLQLVFGISLALLIVSSTASYIAIQRLVDTTEMVNHTYNVLAESEGLFYTIRESESNHRGYLLTHDQSIYAAYQNTYPKTLSRLNTLRQLTGDNPQQQKRLSSLRLIIDERFRQFEKTIRIDSLNRFNPYDRQIDNQSNLLYGQQVMERLRTLIREMQAEENRLLAIRTEELKKYTGYTPPIILTAALISLAISLMSYIRIKKDMDERLAKQKLEEEKYLENNRRITLIEGVTGGLASGKYDVRSNDTGNDEIGRIATALNSMAVSLEDNFNALARTDWQKTGIAKVNDAIRGQKALDILAGDVLQALASYLRFPVGSMYASNGAGGLDLAGGYALAGAPQQIAMNEGIIGQALRDRNIISIDGLPKGYVNIKSSLGQALPDHITIVPLFVGNLPLGAIEIGSLRKLNIEEFELLENVRENIAIAVNSAINNKKLQELLEETQSQAEELQAQHNELENINTELEAQAQKLQTSEEELKVQQEELLHANQELEENTRALEERNQLIIERNHEIQQKAEDLAIATKYKSEFLANMSHELRTPLNSILLLSRLLSENNDKNLSGEQIEFAQVIQSSGNGLLNLIDEILDLSKIEAGKMDLEYSTVLVKEVVNDMKGLFSVLAKEKGLELKMEIENTVPLTMETDKMRLEQILKNLLSNALKFTAHGSVALHVSAEKDYLTFTVSDTGIGIPEDKQQLVFEAFQQADGSTRRKFGGTGLGLSISRELAKLLGGDITLTSKYGEGSAFTVKIPASRSVAPVASEVIMPVTRQASNTISEDQDTELSDEPVKPKRNYTLPEPPLAIPDDRDSISEGDKALLIIEDDTAFAKALLEYTRKQGYKGLVAVRGDEGIELAQRYKPLGILLDIVLPVKDGWEVIEELKANPATRHIPVHTMSSNEFKKESLTKGAINFINKPVAFEQMQVIFNKLEQVLSREHKKVLIVEENTKHAQALAFFLENFEVNTEIRHSIQDGINSLTTKDVDCVILDMGIPDQKAYEMLEEAKKNPGLDNIPIIVFTGKSLSKTEESRIRQYADSIVVKTAHSYKRILDEVSLFLHLMEEQKKPSVESRYKKLGALSEVLENKTVLIADDDVRNIYSLTKALESMKMNVISAIDGKDALKQLEQNPNIDLILMDMMMPEMDGYETTTTIRKMPKYRNLPVIAVTAKAMSGDREKCIKAGASDYITKPVDIDQLLSLLRVWLYDKGA